MSFTILHRVEIEAPTSEVLAALTEPTGLAAWWTPMVEAVPEVGSVARFRFGDGSSGPDMRIEALNEDRVGWHCVDGPWRGHRMEFVVLPHPRGSELKFRHEGWAAADDFFMHCNTKWGFFLGVSLKLYLESGTGRPHPEDPKL